jgi:hypothetical protein
MRDPGRRGAVYFGRSDSLPRALTDGAYRFTPRALTDGAYAFTVQNRSTGALAGSTACPMFAACPTGLADCRPNLVGAGRARHQVGCVSDSPAFFPIPSVAVGSAERSPARYPAD